jgi:DNA polymerase-3 subunit delta'
MGRTGASVWSAVPGQDAAVDLLRGSANNPLHAYLMIGPEGCGKEAAARAFAAVLVSGSDDPTDRANSLVMRGVHPDVHEVRRDGASILKDQADEVIQMANTTAVEGTRKVIIMHEVNLMQPTAAVRLLKTLEEPAEGVHLVLLADQMVDTLVTVASRCLTVHFGLLGTGEITEALVATGITAATAAAAAAAAHGSLDRARLLATDPQLVHRREQFAGIPRRVDGSGSTVIAIVDEVLSLIDDAAAPLERRHEQEAAELEANMAAMGVKRGGKKTLEDRHKRELRRHRTDELRAGLSEVAAVYRNELVSGRHLHRPESYIAAVEKIHIALGRLALNVNETILLRDLFWSLPSLETHAALQFPEN